MAFWVFLLFLVSSITGVRATVFTLRNNCNHTVWPGIQPSSGQPILQNGGFQLKSGQNKTITAPTGWSGRFWGRLGCSFDRSGRGQCITGDCGALRCAGAGGVPPATLAEFTLGNTDFYDVSLVDGYNLPVSIFPSNDSSTCRSAHCVSDVNRSCPPALQVKKAGQVVACKSACFAFNTPEYCCTGVYANPSSCKPSGYSRVFKAACPTAYSYAYDDPSSILTCNSGADYVISFC